MARSVYVLGAGFSHGFNSDLYPLVRDFLGTAKELFLYEPENRHRDLSVIIAKYFNDPLYPDLEKVLSFLSASPLHHHTIPFEHRSVLYDELVEIIVGVLSQASKSEASSEETKETYEKFAVHLGETESTIITFNYDLLIESLLTETYKWHRYDGYGVHIPVAFDAMPTSPHTFMDQRLKDVTVKRWPRVTLLKLHGSINWGRPTIAEDKGDDIYQVPVSEGLSMADFAISTNYGSPFTLYFKPVIIPPILDKSFWLRNPSFRVIWNMAMEAVDAADSITFVGYSLPPTDFMAEFMFRQGVNLHSSETRIVVVDPKVSKVRERFLDVFASAPILDIKFEESDFVSYANQHLVSQIQ